MSKSDKLFSYEDVCNVLCQGCKHGLITTWQDSVPTHWVNDTPVPCRAIDWRNNTEVHKLIKKQQPND